MTGRADTSPGEAAPRLRANESEQGNCADPAPAAASARPGTDPARTATAAGTDPARPGTDPARPGAGPARTATAAGTDPARPGTDPARPGTDPARTATAPATPSTPGAPGAREGAGPQERANGGEAAEPEAGGSDGGDEGREPQGDDKVILDDLVALAAQRDEYLGALQRLQADFENYRKRVLRQQEEQAARAASDLVGKLLPVLDTLDLAEAHLRAAGPGEAGHDAQALSQARAQLVDVLAKEGLERVDQAEVAFDPVIHDAVAHAPAGESGGPGQGHEAVVDEVLRAGYRWRGQVLRPAMVRVRS